MKKIDNRNDVRVVVMRFEKGLAPIDIILDVSVIQFKPERRLSKFYGREESSFVVPEQGPLLAIQAPLNPSLGHTTFYQSWNKTGR